MNKRYVFLSCLAAIISLSASAQIGKPFIHDPSTIMECDGKYYTFGTGGGGLVSEDGWQWNTGAVRPGGGAAPDAIKIGDRYLIAYSSTGGGLGGGHAGRVLTMWASTLDPSSPQFGYSDPVEVASSEIDEDCDAIDAGLFLDPADGRLWLTYGTYFGAIRLVELDPSTGKRVEGNQALDVAIDCEASDMFYKGGWYYLLGTHGTCCDGINSTYNIVVGRSRSVTGPYLDNVGRDMLRGGGKMVLGAEERKFGAGHFGLIDSGDGVLKMSCHYEADLDRSGRSVLAIRPLLWRDGWPVAGEEFKGGTYVIESARSGFALELAVDFVRAEGSMRGWYRHEDNEPEVVVESQKLQDVIGGWPLGAVDARLGEYMARPHQRWSIIPVPEAGGYLGGPYCKILIEGTDRALSAAAGAELTVAPSFTGAPEQLWRIEQLVDGYYRIMPKAIPGTSEKYALVAVGDSSPSLAKFDFGSDNSKWLLKDH